MKKKSLITIITIACILVVIIFVTWNANRGTNLTNLHVTEDQKIEKNEWEEHKFILVDDSVHVYKVTWDQKYGVTRTEYCKAAFRNDKQKQYKLVAPWLDEKIIERVNMNDIRFDKILLDSIPESYPMIRR